jgi:hypothetical protein
VILRETSLWAGDFPKSAVLLRNRWGYGSSMMLREVDCTVAGVPKPSVLEWHDGRAPSSFLRKADRWVGEALKPLALLRNMGRVSWVLWRETGRRVGGDVSKSSAVRRGTSFLLGKSQAATARDPGDLEKGSVGAGRGGWSPPRSTWGSQRVVVASVAVVAPVARWLNDDLGDQEPSFSLGAGVLDQQAAGRRRARAVVDHVAVDRVAVARNYLTSAATNRVVTDQAAVNRVNNPAATDLLVRRVVHGDLDARIVRDESDHRLLLFEKRVQRLGGAVVESMDCVGGWSGNGSGCR